MKLRYGTYTHGSAEASITLTRNPHLNDAGVPYAYTERWDIKGDLRPETVTQAQISLAILALERAYSVNGRDLTLLHDDGTPSAHRMLSSQSMGGVRIISPPSYPESNNGQFAWGRTYTITAEADFPILTTGAAIVSWSERLSFRGGGPRFAVQEYRNARPRRFLVSQFTPYYATQSGSAEGYAGEPNYPAPLWPGALDEPNSSVEFDSPKAIGSGPTMQYVNHRVTWNYSFVSESPLNGRPSPRPRF